jgi:uncharacterized protein YndB with AHSA1/START domain
MILAEDVAIDAPPETVFRAITDFGRYAEWNPWIREAAGGTNEGDVVRIAVKLGSRTTRVRHRILTHRPNVEFRWCDLGWFTALAYGERARHLAPLANGATAYRVELRVTGPAALLVEKMLGRAMADGLRAETEALKRRAESLARV